MSEKKMWPTPVVSDGNGAVSAQAFFSYTEEQQARRTSFLREAVLFPAPGTTGLSNGSGNCEKANQLFEEGVITDEERKSFRAGNGGQLNPDWVEWLMGWPIGWTRLSSMNPDDYERWKSQAMNGSLWEHDPAELPGSVFIPRITDEKEFRQQRLKALGNGQVPSAACLAESILQEADND